MKLSKQTLDILKNFAAINSNFLFKAGQKQGTLAVSKSLMAEVTLEETFPVDAGIFNMNEFLGVISLFSTPEFDFQQEYVVVSEGKNKIKYMYADSSLLLFPTNSVNMATPSNVTLDLPNDVLIKMQKAASALSVSDVSIVGDGKIITATVFDVKNPTSNNFSIDLGDHNGKPFEVYYKLDRLSKLYPGNYTVDIVKNKSKFKHTSIDLAVYIAIEANSKFS